MNIPDKPCRSLTVRTAGISDRLYLVHRRDAYELGEVATLVWSLCDGRHTVPDIVEDVVSQFAVSRETARADVAEFVTELHAAGLLDDDGSG